ncbi:FKBP-type peptidyl-prolyl cis-trans isomerase [Pontibacter sp. G13]|uniref:FKBP-type peptidyl-prolyl cis-trans isomerase n=1 Tax=Pontibacter sp. G13 TaxID=3074898 RepID=UPI00288A4CD5|nr:FKBP-type peptidyl-prolyl cis-trans isomerase [Pontibacter sp. G13]WNJ19008.1 FKBP-type peptidyl-prolyl cis-trans isomerase [Pontibacter sp. G13]
MKFQTIQRISVFFAVAMIAVFSGCSDNVTFEDQMTIDKDLILEYAADNNIDGQFDDDDVYYAVTKEGNGQDFPDATDKVEIVYSGFLLNGTQFDSSNGFPVQFELGTLIRGWQLGLTHFSVGSEGVLLIPSRLGYGTNGAGSAVPGDAVLRFDIKLVDII